MIFALIFELSKNGDDTAQILYALQLPAILACGYKQPIQKFCTNTNNYS